MIDQPPESLVRGCNDPVSIGVLSDWIEEQYGIVLDYEQSGWSDGCSYVYGGFHDYSFGNLNTNGCGCGYRYGTGSGCGTGCGYLDGYGDFIFFIFGDGSGCGYGFYNGNGNGAKRFS